MATMTPEELAETTGLSPEAVEKALAHLKELGLVYEANEADGGLTPEQATAMRVKARKIYAHEGSLEIDDKAPISVGGDPGCYVQAWVWVAFDWADDDDDDDDDEEGDEDDDDSDDGV